MAMGTIRFPVLLGLLLSLVSGCAATAPTPSSTPSPSDLIAALAPTSQATLPATSAPRDLPASSPVTLVWQLDGAPMKFDRITRVAVDDQNDLYVLDRVQHRILKYDSDGHFLTAWGREGRGDGEFTFGTSFGFGGGIAASTDHVYVADGTRRIQKFDSQGNFLLAWGGEGTGEGRFQRISALAVDHLGHIYAADANTHTIQRFDANGVFLTSWGSEGQGNGQFQRPSSIAVDSLGHVLVSDQTQRVQKFDSAGRWLTAWGVRGAGAGEFNGSIHLGIDPQGIIFAADGSNHRVQVFDREGNYLTQWGQQGNGPGEFGFAGGIAVDREGAIYVADITNVRVQKFRPRHPWPTELRGTPTPRPPTPTPTPLPTRTPVVRPFITPTDR